MQPYTSLGIVLEAVFDARHCAGDVRLPLWVEGDPGHPGGDLGFTDRQREVWADALVSPTFDAELEPRRYLVRGDGLVPHAVDAGQVPLEVPQEGEPFVVGQDGRRETWFEVPLIDALGAGRQP